MNRADNEMGAPSGWGGVTVGKLLDYVFFVVSSVGVLAELAHAFAYADIDAFAVAEDCRFGVALRDPYPIATKAAKTGAEQDESAWQCRS